MKRMMLFIAGILIHINLFAQPPLSGDYTIGGSSPDFAGFPDAITAVHNNGISGPVNFHIRPGVYEPENAGEAVISILDTIAGVGSTNRITFQPDASSGGTVDNVILQTPQATTALNEGSIIEIRSDYITIQQLTLQNADTTSGSKISPLIWVTVAQGANDVSGISVIECKLFGASTASRARSGFGCGTTSYNFVLQDNLVTEVHDGITFPTQSATTHALQIVGNQLSDLQTYLNNLSAEVGTAIQIGRCNDAVVQGNEIDYGGGSSGLRAISLSSADNFLIDGNRIVSLSGGNGAGVNDNFRAIQVSNFYRPNGSGQISNNMIAGIYAQVRSGIDISNGNNIDVFHNSIRFPPRGIASWTFAGAFHLSGNNNRVINNIFIDLSTSGNRVAAMHIADTTGNVFDYNNIIAPSVLTAYANSTEYDSLEQWQQTGFDSHSLDREVTFVHNGRDLHLSECSVADDSLRGIGLTEVTTDFDGELRDPVAPFMGADEAEGEVPQVFAPPLNFASGQQSFLMTGGDLDADGDIDLAVTNSQPNNGSNDVSLLWNNGTGMFSVPQPLPFGTDPTVIKTAFLNNDTLLDLAVLAVDSVWIRFGLGSGNFTVPVPVITGLDLVDLEVADYDIDGDRDIFLLHSPANDSGEVRILVNDGDGTFTWTDFAQAGYYLDDLLIADFDDDGFVDLAVVDNTSTNKLYTMKNLGVIQPGISNGFDTAIEYPVNVLTTPSASNFLSGDFDGDQGIDLILGDALSVDSLVLMRNNGDGTFAGREAFRVHGRETPRISASLDYEGDGDLDLVTANATENIHLLLNDGLGTFELFFLCESGELPGFPHALLTAPLDADESGDAAVLTLADTVAILKNLNWMPVSIQPQTNTGEMIAFHLGQNYPNPFNPTTTIRYRISKSSRVKIDVFNILGQQVATLVDGQKKAGSYEIVFDARNNSGKSLASGMYFYRLQAGEFIRIRKMLLVR